MLRLVRGLAFCGCALLASGSVSFAQEAAPAAAPAPAAAASAPAAVPEAAPVAAAKAPSDLSGHWSGTWCIYTNGHNGPIEADFVRVCDNQYQVHFRGRFFTLFPFSYRVNLDVVGTDGDKVILSGSSNLGLFGTFSYTAWVSDTQFVASYCSRKDQGVFTMNRCTRGCQ